MTKKSTKKPQGSDEYKRAVKLLEILEKRDSSIPGLPERIAALKQRIASMVNKPRSVEPTPEPQPDPESEIQRTKRVDEAAKRQKRAELEAQLEALK